MSGLRLLPFEGSMCSRAILIAGCESSCMKVTSCSCLYATHVSNDYPYTSLHTVLAGALGVVCLHNKCLYRLSICSETMSVIYVWMLFVVPCEIQIVWSSNYLQMDMCCIGPCDKIDTSLYFTGIYTLLDCSNIHYVSIYHLPSVLLPYTIPFKILGWPLFSRAFFWFCS